MPDEKNHLGSGMLTAAIVLLGIYVFFPVVILLPLIAAVEHHWLSSSVAENVAVIFAPLKLLSDHLPLYRHMLDAEFDFILRMGWVHQP